MTQHVSNPVSQARLCAKTLLAIEFLLRGILDHGEAGVSIAFEETAAINGEQGERALARYGPADMVPIVSCCSICTPIANEGGGL
ncbi:MAG: hypothetical protein KJZ87_01765 [Thermoguttaceae bacterium]|nr:hypothetical protein [Thermoguttaceae bacterium]